MMMCLFSKSNVLVLVAALALLSLTGWCEEAPDPGVTLIKEREIMGSRGPRTRVFEKIYKIDNMDNYGNFTGESYTKTQTLVEKADGLCYDASLNSDNRIVESPEWLPTNTEFQLLPSGGWSIESGPARVRVYRYASDCPLVN